MPAPIRCMHVITPNAHWPARNRWLLSCLMHEFSFSARECRNWLFQNIAHRRTLHGAEGAERASWGRRACSCDGGCARCQPANDEFGIGRSNRSGCATSVQNWAPAQCLTQTSSPGAGRTVCWAYRHASNLRHPLGNDEPMKGDKRAKRCRNQCRRLISAECWSEWQDLNLRAPRRRERGER
jgi:hypothetical protein